jgi:hypothetical protein
MKAACDESERAEKALLKFLGFKSRPKSFSKDDQKFSAEWNRVMWDKTGKLDWSKEWRRR